MASRKSHPVIRKVLAVAMGVSLFGPSLFAQAPKPRKWKDATGKFEIEATFISEANGVVTLKQTNGEEVEIQLKQLSPADEAYVRTEIASKNVPSKSKAAPPPTKLKESVGPTGTTEPASAPPAAPSLSPPAVAVNWQNAPPLAARGAPEWSKISITPAPTKKLRSVQLPTRREISERLAGVALGDGFAIVGYTLQDHFNKGIGESTRLVRVNLESGKVEGTIITDGLYTVMDVSPTGEQILMRKDPPLGKQATDIELWRPAGKVVERQKSFAPFAASAQGRQDVDQAFIGVDGKVVVVGFGRIGIFDSNAGEAVGSIPEGGHSAALSPDRKYAAVVGESVLLVDLARGQVVASLPIEKISIPTVAFSPDGQRLAVAGFDHLKVWNLKDGTVYRDEIVPGLGTGSLLFTSPTHILGSGALTDIENHLPVWSYNGITKALAAGNSTVMLADRGIQGSMLIAASLPHPAAQQALKQALAAPGLFAVKPGSTMTIDVSAITDPTEQQKARSGLEASIAAAGMKLAANSPVVIKASMSTSNEQRQFQKVFARGSETTPVNAITHTAKVELLVNGQPAWQTSSVSGTGFSLFTEKGESVQDAANRQSKPDYSLFANVSLPQYVVQPGPSTRGQSFVDGPNF
ncbi:hypothetical protein AYO47_04995 [Planctomyces sp. SCGC AG-212-M04]|nr:hypothetical protein AYO47_04995 [Planctomyces sp. SCGC AG-212-M04]